MLYPCHLNGMFCLLGGEPESEIWDLLAGSAEAEKVPQAVCGGNHGGHGTRLNQQHLKWSFFF